MTFTKKQDGSALTVFLEGRLDSVTAPELEPELLGALDGVTALSLDFEKLEYISSAGLRLLLSARKRLAPGAQMRVCHPNETVQEIFDITGFNELFTVEY